MPINERAFEAKVDRTGEHHLWLGTKSTDGFGQIRVDGRLTTAVRVAWIIANGPISDDVRVLSCPDERSCVRVDHLRLTVGTAASGPRPTRARRGTGSITETAPNSWKVVADAGRDDSGARRRITRTVHGTKTDATRALATLLEEVRDRGALPARDERATTVDDLIDWYVTFARDDRGLDHSTLVGYVDAYEHWLKPSLGNKRASAVTAADLDKAFGKMRKAGLSRSRMNNARSVLSGAYKWGRRHGKVHRNPVDHFELPLSTRTPKATVAPEVDDLLALLDAADEHDEILAPVLKLGATTGLRRGELCGLKRDRLHLDRGELVVDRAVNDAGGVVVEKQTKTRQRRVVSLDPATVEMLRAHLSAMNERAALCGISMVEADAYVSASIRRATRRCGPSS